MRSSWTAPGTGRRHGWQSVRQRQAPPQRGAPRRVAATEAASLGATLDRVTRAEGTARGQFLIGLAVVLVCVFAYEGVLRALLLGFVRLPLVPGGLSSLTAIVAMSSLAHAWYALGGRHTLAFFGLSAAISWVYEQVGVATGLVFGAYHYTDYLGARLGDVPLLIPLAWFMMIYPSYVIANLVLERQTTGTPDGLARLIRLAAVSAVVMTVWDLVIDPILSGPSVRAWIWETGGPYFGNPDPELRRMAADHVQRLPGLPGPRAALRSDAAGTGEPPRRCASGGHLRGDAGFRLALRRGAGRAGGHRDGGHGRAGGRRGLAPGPVVPIRKYALTALQDSVSGTPRHSVAGAPVAGRSGRSCLTLVE